MLLVCNGMMRSGSTLQYNLARLLLAAAHDARPLGFFLEPTEIQNHPSLRDWLGTDGWYLLKTHRYWQPPSDSMAGVRRCYIYRDIRDVAASARRKFPVTWSELLGILDEAIELDDKIRRAPNVLVQRYETVIEYPTQACTQLAHYLNLDIGDAMLRRITQMCMEQTRRAAATFPFWQALKHALNHNRVNICKRLIGLVPAGLRTRIKQFDILRRAGDQVTQATPAADPQTLIHPDHFSPWRGEVGCWRHVFSAEQASVLESRYESWLAEQGYTLSFR